MGDSLLDLVEQRLQSNLSLDLSPRVVAKSALPFTILSLEGSPVLHLFAIPPERSIFGASPGEKPKFGVVTLNGCITVFDTMFRKVTWRRQTSLEKVSWGTLSWRKSGSCPNPSIMVHSRQHGFHHVKIAANMQSKLSSSPSSASGGGGGGGRASRTSNEDPPVNELLSSETHIGFCKPYLCQDQTVIVPIGSSSIGIHLQKENSPPSSSIIHPSYTFPSSILALKEIGNKGDSKFILVTTEDGQVSVVSCCWKDISSSCSTAASTLVSKLLLPKYSPLEDQPIGTCIEGDATTFVIGSSLRYLFVVKFDLNQDDLRLTSMGKKILPTEGVSCLAMREGNTILGAGCFDGTLRIFGFPDMNQISAVHYHSSQINSLLFLNEKVDKGGKWYLLCGSGDSAGLSVWSIPHGKAVAD